MPTPVFNGTLPSGWTMGSPSPFASVQLKRDYIPSGISASECNGIRRVFLTDHTHPWAEMWVNNNGFYGVNTADNPDTATCRAQLDMPDNPSGVFNNGATSVIVNRVRHNMPQLPSSAKAPTSGPVSTAGSPFASGGLGGIYGPPFAGSGPNTFRIRNNGSGGIEMYKAYRTGGGTTIGTFRLTIPANTTITVIRRNRQSSGRNVNDALEELWVAIGKEPVERMTYRKSDGTTTQTMTGWCNVTDANYIGPQGMNLQNYFRFGMWTGIITIHTYGPIIYRGADVPTADVPTVDPYVVFNESGTGDTGDDTGSTTPTPVPGELLFDGTRLSAFQQQEAFTDRITEVATPSPLSGMPSTSIRFRVAKDDPLVETGQRAEVLHGSDTNPPAMYNNGKVVWQRFWLRLDPGFPFPDSAYHTLFNQLKRLTGSPKYSLDVRADGRLKIHYQDDYPEGWISRPLMTTGVWHAFIVGLGISTTSGWIEIWHRDSAAESSLTKKFYKSGIVTAEELTSYMKYGIYRGNRSDPDAITHMAGIQVYSTLAAAQASFGTTSTALTTPSGLAVVPNSVLLDPNDSSKASAQLTWKANPETGVTYSIQTAPTDSTTWTEKATTTVAGTSTAPFTLTNLPGIGNTTQISVVAKTATQTSARSNVVSVSFEPTTLDQATVNAIWNKISDSATKTAATLSSTAFPTVSNTSGVWQTVSATHWTAGFWPGILWRLFKRTGTTTWADRARARCTLLDAQKTFDSHDLGMMFMRSLVEGWQQTGDEALKAGALTAANTLSARYNSTVKAVRSWDFVTAFNTIIDSLMNMELLFWAAKNGGDQALYDRAVQHLLTLRAHHLRADGSHYHVVEYDSSTGVPTLKRTHQGFNNESTWARGQAWGIYGFAIGYRETQDTQFLDAATAMADYFISKLPADKIPYWDLELPSLTGEPRDTSAASIAASGLLLLAQLSGNSTYRTVAESILVTLFTSAYRSPTTWQPVLQHGTGSKPEGSAIDVGLIYGDYFYADALYRLETVLPPPERTKPAAPVQFNSWDKSISFKWTTPTGLTSTDKWSIYIDGVGVVSDLHASTRSYTYTSPSLSNNTGLQVQIAYTGSERSDPTVMITGTTHGGGTTETISRGEFWSVLS